MPPPGFVNSAMNTFIESIRVAIERFPYYSREADLAETTLVAKDMARLLERVDPPAMTVDGFWQTFVDDLANGDFGTEDILSLKHRDA